MKNRKENREGFLSKEMVTKIENRELLIEDIKSMEAGELGYALDVKKVVA